MFFFSSRRRHTRFKCDWSSDVCSSDLDQKFGQFIVRGWLEQLIVLFGRHNPYLAEIGGVYRTDNGAVYVADIDYRRTMPGRRGARGYLLFGARLLVTTNNPLTVGPLGVR